MTTSQDRAADSGGARQPLFHVDYHRPTNRLTIRVEGFWSPDDAAEFAREVGAKARAAQAVRPDFDVCVESLDFPVQAMDVAHLLSRIMIIGMGLTTGRAAVVVGSQLNKLQAERTLSHPRLRVFDTVARGHEWLNEATPG